MDRILVVVDMQNDFISGALGTPEAAAIVPDVVKRIHAAKSGNEVVMFTLDTHAADYLSTAEGKLLPVAHCIKGSGGWNFPDEIAAEVAPNMRIFEKPTFGSNELVSAIVQLAKSSGRNDGGKLRIELCGVCTDICVVTNALLLKTAVPEACIAVNPALCAGVTPEKHAAAIETMRSCQILTL